jgi:hypothetical protein
MSAPSSSRALRLEPTALLPLRWGGYRERYLGGLTLIVGGGVAIAGSDTFALWLLWAGSIAHIVGWCIMPAAGWRRLVVALPSTISMWLLLPGPRYLVVLVLPYLGWLLVRHRPALAYPTAIFVLAGAILLGQVFSEYRDMIEVLSVEFAIMVGAAWVARAIRPVRRAARRPTEPQKPTGPQQGGRENH